MPRVNASLWLYTNMSKEETIRAGFTHGGSVHVAAPRNFGALCMYKEGRFEFRPLRLVLCNFLPWLQALCMPIAHALEGIVLSAGCKPGALRSDGAQGHSKNL